MTPETLQLDQVYVRAAARGDPDAQGSLANLLLSHGEDQARTKPSNPGTVLELLTMAEMYARQAVECGRRAVDLATLAAVYPVRCRYITETDPVRSVFYRQRADELFDTLMQSGDPDALVIAGAALTTLAAAGDDEAAERLNRVVDLLPPDEAVFLRQWAKHSENEAVVPVKGE